ncbi:MAG: hypothetical protein HY098_03910 [Nitrospinae bacterium]|nr:hypothetical protein [Nitrospinota bacterium]
MKNKLVVHTHHIASHFTNGLWPVVAFLLTVYYFNGDASFERASFYCFIFSTLSAPFVLGSGWTDWKTRFQGRPTMIFNHKRFFGSLFLASSLLLVVWRATDAAAAAPAGPSGLVYAAIVYVDTIFVIYLGYLGGKFI